MLDWFRAQPREKRKQLLARLHAYRVQESDAELREGLSAVICGLEDVHDVESKLEEQVQKAAGARK